MARFESMTSSVEGPRIPTINIAVSAAHAVPMTLVLVVKPTRLAYTTVLAPAPPTPAPFRRCFVQPTKAEKEPMRHLYDSYNNLKHQIRDVESLLVAHRQQVSHEPRGGLLDRGICWERNITCYLQQELALRVQSRWC